jgi:hypothetical protein
MASEDETRRISGGQGDPQKTRLVRRDEEKPTELAGKAPVAGGPDKTRVIMRPRSPSIDQTAKAPSEAERLVTGWLVVVHGPGRGHFAPIYDGLNSIGRGPDQATVLNFGDDGISREQHAFITYDFKTQQFFLQHGGKSAIVRLNEQPVLQPTILKDRDIISISQTTLRFVAFCGANFDWAD